jgi:hypothetical protein
MVFIGFGVLFLLLGLGSWPHSIFGILLGVILTAIGVGRVQVKRSGDRKRQAEEAEIRAHQLRIIRGEVPPPGGTE